MTTVLLLLSLSLFRSFVIHFFTFKEDDQSAFPDKDKAVRNPHDMCITLVIFVASTYHLYFSLLNICLLKNLKKKPLLATSNASYLFIVHIKIKSD